VNTKKPVPTSKTFCIIGYIINLNINYILEVELDRSHILASGYITNIKVSIQTKLIKAQSFVVLHIIVHKCN